MNNKREQQRLQALFADLERLTADPRGKSPEMKREIEQMRARLLELEELILNDCSSDAKHEAVPLASSLGIQTGPAHFQVYETDKIAYAFSDEKLEVVPDSNQVLPDLIR